MGTSRFVRPDTCTLKISRGDTLTVKRRLNTGEYRAHLARLYLAGGDGVFRKNPFQVGLATVVAYLLDWSLTDDDGKPVVIRDVSAEQLSTILDALDTDSFQEIREAIEAHESAMEAERTQEKKLPAGVSTSSTPSILPDAAPGPMSTSTPLTLTSTR